MCGLHEICLKIYNPSKPQYVSDFAFTWWNAHHFLHFIHYLLVFFCGTVVTNLVMMSFTFSKKFLKKLRCIFMGQLRSTWMIGPLKRITLFFLPWHAPLWLLHTEHASSGGCRWLGGWDALLCKNCTWILLAFYVQGFPINRTENCSVISFIKIKQQNFK